MHDLQTTTTTVRVDLQLATLPHQLIDKKPLQNAGVGLPWSDIRYYDNSWFEISEDLRNRRWKNVVLVDRMLRGHRPHEVLTHVPQNTNWESKTFTLALKIERLMFFAAKSRESYLNERTLRTRVRFISRCLVRLRERKNLAYTGTSDPRLMHLVKRHFA
jgi:hypothetical protein